MHHILIECGTSFDLNIERVTSITSDHILKRSKFWDIKYVKTLANRRNNISKYQKVVTRQMILAIRLYIIKPICPHIEKSHFNTSIVSKIVESHFGYSL